jgi:hypothetical protein
MERPIDSYQWISKMETRFLRCLLSGKPDPEMDAASQTADAEPIVAHLIQGGRAGRMGFSLKSQPVRVQRIVSRKADSKHGHYCAESIAARRFENQLLCELSRFKA